MSEKTVLIVEDEMATAEMLKFLLEQSGFRVALAANGIEALAYLDTHVPDLVLTDLMMPLMDGRTLTRAIKGRPDLSDVPVVLMSAAPHAARQDPGPVFFPKPLDLDALLAVVEDLTGDQHNGGGGRQP